MRNLRFNNYLHHVFGNKNLNSFFAGMTIRMFAINLVVFFLPAVMWERGLGLREIAVFYFLWAVSHACMTFTATRLVHKIGARNMFLVAVPLYIIYIYLVGDITAQSVVLIAVIAGVSNSIFWTAYHLYFSSQADAKNRGKKVSSLQFLTGIVMMIAPLLGGFMLEQVSYHLVVVIMAVLLVSSLAPLRDIKHARIKKVKALDIGHILASRNGFAYVARGSAGAPAWVVWPLMLFLLLEGFMNLGMVTFATSLVSLVVMLWLGNVIDKVKYRKALNATSFLEGAVNIAKVFVTIPLVAIIVDVVEKLVIKSYFMVFDTRSYELGRDPEHIAAREMGINLGAGLVFLIIIIFPSFHIAFVLAALGSLWSMLL